ncbi:mitochondrial import inner membrane translocase subunit tim54 [Delitschia confertaspora ATCC 74209]|uniref:Mitochondrial import inner membrane translocase subunit TIM54 n=1 Tax=Delitschia confertaspora ATCC 74209 TaxID=1513339 RepID=A0A9P4MQZ2_9PLEO|nr:mitochondrial import inner membrane translocase subunit tim54 [Delitschia confertaspora ATCC 74209]
MAEQDAKASQPSSTGSSASGATKPPRPPNPVWRMMGLPNFRFKLPSRNWMIFLTITGSWTAAVVYDRREKKRIQKKWAKLVEHIAREPVEVHQLPRKLSVYISAPPADGLVSAREHFNEYVKPILVAAALDWDAVEGRKEGDVRAGLAERIRKLRKQKGEPSNEPIEEDVADLLEQVRKNTGVEPYTGIAGDIVIGRHSWKEYVRGLHEGWLGPLDPPVEVVETLKPAAFTLPTTESPAAPVEQPATPVGPSAEQPASTTQDDASPTVGTDAPPKEPEKEVEKPAEEEKKSKKKKQPPPFNSTADYTNSHLSPNCPSKLGPTTVIPFPHLLGFLNFPIRMYRFLNRRQVAEEVGRQTAAAVLASYGPYSAPSEGQSGAESLEGGSKWEQQGLLAHEEKEWHKTVRDRKDDNGKERVWLDDMVLDPRIAERMQKFVLDMGAEERAKRIATEKEESWLASLWSSKKEERDDE